MTNNDSSWVPDNFDGFPDKAKHLQLHKWLHIVGIPVIVLVGLVANCLCLLTYCRSRLRVLSSSFYIVTITITHSLYLLRWIVAWLENFDVFKSFGFIACFTLSYSIYVLTFVSVYTFLAMTAERCVIVYFPQKRLQWCKPWRAKAIVTSIVLTAMVIYSVTFLLVDTVTLNHSQTVVCFPKSTISLLGVNIPFQVVDVIIAHLLPASAIVALNIAIAWKIRHFICHVTSAEDSTDLRLTSCIRLQLSRDGIPPQLPRSLSKILKQDFNLRTTRSCLCASCVYLALYVPITALNIASKLFNFNNYYSRYITAIHVCHFISYVNYATTSLLFCLSNRSSRFALLRLLRKRK